MLLPLRTCFAPFPGTLPSFPHIDESDKEEESASHSCHTVVEELEIHEAFVTQLLKTGYAFLDRAWRELSLKKLKVGYSYETANRSDSSIDNGTSGP